MDRRNRNALSFSTTAKVSHSLDTAVEERLKDLAYWERVSESSIIEFLLTEFFSLGDNATLGRIIRGSAMTIRRDRSTARDKDLKLVQLQERLAFARSVFVKAVEAWKNRPCVGTLNQVDLARLEIAAVRNKVNHSLHEADSDAEMLRWHLESVVQQP